MVEKLPARPAYNFSSRRHVVMPLAVLALVFGAMPQARAGELTDAANATDVTNSTGVDNANDINGANDVSDSSPNGKLLAFNPDPKLTSEELAKLRGGFDLGNGSVVNFGLEIQQYVNKMLVNDVNIVLVKNNFTVTQTTNNGATTSTTTSNLTGPTTFTAPTNNPATNVAVTVTNQAIQSVIQNSANNQALATNATLNVSTQGVMNGLRQAIGSAQLIQTMQMSAWLRH